MNESHSDPMRQVLTNMMYYLAKEPRHLRLIREELALLQSVYDYKTIQTLQHFNAFISETMRLNPPVPCAGLRITPPGGLQIGNIFIPGGTTVLVPHWIMFHSMFCRQKID